MVEETWTILALKEHLEARISALKENVGTALIASDKAVSKAEVASERRFDGVNEFRQTLSDATGVSPDRFLLFLKRASPLQLPKSRCLHL